MVRFQPIAETVDSPPQARRPRSRFVSPVQLPHRVRCRALQCTGRAGADDRPCKRPRARQIALVSIAITIAVSKCTNSEHNYEDIYVWVCMGVLTTKTQPGPSIERKVSPADILQRVTFPPLRSELIRILAVEVLSSVHRIYTVSHALTRLDQKWSRPVRPAAGGERRHADRFPRVYGHRRIQAQNLCPVSPVSFNHIFARWTKGWMATSRTFFDNQVQVRHPRRLEVILGRRLRVCAEATRGGDLVP